ncbi:MAG: extracellular solute-binding protein [Nodosilinea sp. LVE1205-7]|jgi:putative spermidine/putrescine transport system substrate-binding protein
MSYSRRGFIKYSAGFGSGVLLAQLGSCASKPGGNTVALTLEDWAKPADVTRAKDQVKEFITYGMPDDWANYGEVRKKFAEKYGFEFQHQDTDMSSLEEITKFDAEKSNPKAMVADIGMLYGPLAEQRSVVPSYLPANAAALPIGFKATSGGWVATFVGVPAIVVNTDVIKTVPRTWADLAKPEYQGKIGAIDPTKSGTAATSFLSWVYASGGDESNMAPGVGIAKKIVANFAAPEGNAQTLEKGEVPIQIKYDYNCNAAAAKVKEKGIKAEVVIPGVSIYAPSALMLNKYHVNKMDAAKLFVEYVLSDEGQEIFAKFGARPIRYVLGNLKLPEAAKANWLPESQYAQVKQVKDWTKVNPETIGKFWKDQVVGG